MDVDKFKTVNDQYGHEMGDKVLKKVAKLLVESFRSSDYAARIGGDEFAVILPEVEEDRKAVIEEKIKKINNVLTNPENNMPKTSVSVGVAFSSSGFNDDLYKKADAALYVTKERGRQGCSFYDNGSDTEKKSEES